LEQRGAGREPARAALPDLDRIELIRTSADNPHVNSGVAQVIAAAIALAVAFLCIALAFWRLRRRPSGAEAVTTSASTLGLSTAAAPAGPAGGSAPGADEARGRPAAGARPARPGETSVTPAAIWKELATRLEPAARLLGASGMIVWTCNPGDQQLEVAAAYGYSDAFLDRIGPIALDAPVLTAVAFVEGRTRTRSRSGSRLAAIAVPIERHGLPIGVLTAEVDSSAGDRVSSDAEALVRLLASQMVSPLTALSPPAVPMEASAPATRPTARPRTETLPAYSSTESASLPTLALPATQVSAGAATLRRAPGAFDPIAVTVRVAPGGPTAVPSAPAAPAALPIPIEEPIAAALPIAFTVAPAASPHAPEDDPESTLREARSRFIAGFRKRCSSIDELIVEVEHKGTDGPLLALKQIVHRMSGLALIVSMQTVSARAAELDRLLDAPRSAVEVARLRRAFEDMQDAFAADLAVVPPLWAAPSGQAVGALVMLVTGDAALATRMSADLQGSAYRVTETGNGHQALLVARSERPDVILLDVDLAGEMDGHGVCRRLKGDPALAAIPVVLVASHASTVDRMAGFALGADDYLTKPVQTIEMLLRVRWMLTRPSNDRQPPPRAGGGLLTWDAFVAASREVLHQGAAALGVVRVPHAQMSDMAALFSDDLRRKDLLGRYTDTQLVVLMPGATAGVASRRIGGVLDIARAAGLDAACAGVTATGQSAERFIEPLLGQAESALSAAQVQGAAVVVHGSTTGANASVQRATVLIVDDDPDVVHIIDARLKAAGLQTIVVFDGQQALHRVETSAPSVMVLELMLPKRSGFDVLARLRELPEPRPKVIVVSSRSREEDVMRAFELGADDYLTKPFSPQELLARIGRLLR
jgi:DNA-binding response OmpR family regulator